VAGGEGADASRAEVSVLVWMGLDEVEGVSYALGVRFSSCARPLFTKRSGG
jgi:hypothetical protein